MWYTVMAYPKADHATAFPMKKARDVREKGPHRKMVYLAVCHTGRYIRAFPTGTDPAARRLDPPCPASLMLPPDRGSYQHDSGDGRTTSTGSAPDVDTPGGPSHDDDPASTVVVRPLRTLDEYRACVSLQKETWGHDFSEVVPLALLKVGQRIGGVTAGAFDRQGTLLGFVFGLTGVEDGGRVVHWSDMLAVRRDVRNQGIGRRLKEFQRATLRKLHVEIIYWTFDPLVARNAHLNLNRLGARVIEYVPDMYGTTDSPLHRGLGTDRFVVGWDTGIAGETNGRRPISAVGAHVVNPHEPDDVDLAAARQGAPVVQVRIPADIQVVQTASLDEAARWRQGTRMAFLGLHELGYEVQGFHRDEQGNCGYLMTQPDRGGQAA